MDELTLNDKLNCIYTDFLMLREGAWIPDKHSIDDSITMLSEIAKDLKLTLNDTRE